MRRCDIRVAGGGVTGADEIGSDGEKQYDRVHLHVASS